MAANRKRKKPASVFDSIRKPTAPPVKKMGQERPEEKVHPAGRGSKHKKRTETDPSDGDL